jgi:hypothetical protein
MLRRFRSSFRSLQGAEPSPDDVVEVLSFLRHSLSTFVTPTSNGSKGRRRAALPAALGGDDAAVTLGGAEWETEIFGWQPSTADANLMADLPGLFRRVLGLMPEPNVSADDDDPELSDPRRTTAEPGTEDGDDDDDAPSEAPDAARLYSDIREFLDWARDSFVEAPATDTLFRQWHPRAQMLEMALIFARFYFLQSKGNVASTGALAEYTNRLGGLLNPAFSGAGAAWGGIVGWFPKGIALGRGKLGPLPSRIAAQLVFNTYELVSEKDSAPSARATASALLEGFDRVFGPNVELKKEVQNHLIPVVAAYQTSGGVDAVVEAVSALRQHTTPEQQAVKKFAALLALQDSCRVVQELQAKGGVTSSTPAFAEAVRQQSQAEELCAALCPAEAETYIRRLARGRWKHVVPVRSFGSDACPSCHMALPRSVASQLKKIDQLTVCPSCMALIVPMPITSHTGLHGA